MFDTVPPSWSVAVSVRNTLKSLSKVFVLALIAGITVTGVKQSIAADSSGGKGTIALSLKTITNDDFQKALADAVKAQVESSGYTFLLVTAGEQTAVSTQVNQVEDLIAKKVTGIILNPMDGNAVVRQGT
jgi:ABC-type sugar transport system substrate-binding protein